MEKTKWVLPSETGAEESKELKGLACSMYAVSRYMRAESDLTDALDLLESLHRKFPTKSINDFLIKFKQPK